MSDHLPECPCIAVGVPSCICDNDEECGPQCRHHCICTALRACEQRVKRSEEAWWTNYVRLQQSDSYKAGVQVARDAVAAIPWFDRFALGRRFRSEALAAIDGLTNGQKEA